METYTTKSYKTIRGLIRAVRHYMVKITGDYPEDALTGRYSSNESMEDVLRSTGAYYYGTDGFNIDIEMDSHIYIYMED
jgi:hypothetical protein